jgi:hypothetical protein
MSAVPTPVVPPARISPEIDQVLRKALSKRRSERFPTIKAFARAFDAAVRGLPVRPATPARPMEPVARASTPARAAQPVAREAAPAPRPRRVGRWIVLAVVAAAVGGAWVFRDQPPVAGLWEKATQMIDRR